MSFFNEQKIADEQAINAKWCGGKPGEFFKCALCCHKFVLGDKYRVVYTNDMNDAWGNPIICEHCDGEDIRERWREKWNEWRKIKEKYWWFVH